MNILTAMLAAFAQGWAGWMGSMAWQVAALAGVVWIVTRVFRKTSAAFRHMLWLLVFLKLVLPPVLAAPWSVGTVAQRLLASDAWSTQDSGVQLGEFTIQRTASGHTPKLSLGVPPEPEPGGTAKLSLGVAQPAIILAAVWAVVAAALLATLLIQNRRYLHSVMRDLAPPPSALRERIAAHAQEFRVRGRFDVYVSPHVSVPTVCGLRHPRILLPASVLDQLDAGQLDDLMGHELAHVKRQDIRIGWLASVLVCLYWFHPMVWLASFYLRREREMACDDAVIYTYNRQDGKAYASTMIRMAESFHGAAPAGAGFLGLLEVSDNLLHRIRSVLDGTRKRRPGWRSAAGLILLVLLLVPMGVWAPATSAQTANTTDVEQEIAQYYAKADAEAQEYVRWTANQFGAGGLWLSENAFDGLSADEREAKIVHCAEVLQGEYGRHQCNVLAEASALKDKRLLPGLIKVAAYHREDQNYDCRAKWMAVAALARQGDESAVPTLVPLLDHGNTNTRMWARAALPRLTGQNFGVDKQAWAAWWNGAGKQPPIEAAALAPWKPIEEGAAQSPSGGPPQIVSTTPAQNATDVDPALTAITVTFDQDMHGGFSWTGGPPLFPQGTGKPHWIDKRTCEYPVKLEPAKQYRVGINSKSHQNFRGVNGVPVRPQVIAFTTRGADAATVDKLAPPKIVSMVPENGATGVSPTLDKLTVTFDRPMGGGFSWVGSGEHFPEGTGGAAWSEGRKTCTKPVTLKPNWSYALRLNSENHVNFQSESGVPLEPVLWQFTTGN